MSIRSGGSITSPDPLNINRLPSSSPKPRLGNGKSASRTNSAGSVVHSASVSIAGEPTDLEEQLLKTPSPTLGGSSQSPQPVGDVQPMLSRLGSGGKSLMAQSPLSMELGSGGHASRSQRSREYPDGSLSQPGSRVGSSASQKPPPFLGRHSNTPQSAPSRLGGSSSKSSSNSIPRSTLKEEGEGLLNAPTTYDDIIVEKELRTHRSSSSSASFLGDTTRPTSEAVNYPPISGRNSTSSYLNYEPEPIGMHTKLDFEIAEQHSHSAELYSSNTRYETGISGGAGLGQPSVSFLDAPPELHVYEPEYELVSSGVPSAYGYGPLANSYTNTTEVGGIIDTDFNAFLNSSLLLMKGVGLPPLQQLYTSTTNRDTYTWKVPLDYKSNRYRPTAQKNLPPLEDETTNRSTYLLHSLEPIERYRPPEYSRPDVEFDAPTTYQVDFVERKLDKPAEDAVSKIKKMWGSQYPVKRGEPFDATTTNQDSFMDFQIKKKPPCPAAKALAAKDKGRLKDGHYFFQAKATNK